MNLTKSGAGTVTLSATNAYTGVTTVSGGTLAYGISNALSTGDVTVNGGVLNLSTFSDSVGAVTLTSGTIAGTGTLTSTSGFTMNGTGLASASLAGGVNLTKSGAGTVTTLSGSNSYTGTTTISSGVLALGNTNALAGGGTISFGGGTLQYSASNTADYSARINNSLGAIAIDTNSQDATFASSLGSSNTGGLTKIGLGTLTLSGSNSYTGTTNITGGVLAYGASNALSDSTAVTVAGGTLNLDSYTDTVASFAITSGSLAGSGKLTAATYALGGGTVTGNLGSGTMTVTANSSLSGTADVTAVSLSAGTLTLGSAGRFTSDQVALTGSSGASLSLGGSESIGSLAGGFNVALGSGTLTTGNDNTSTTYAGVLSGSGGLTKAGSGTFTLTGSNSYSGVTTVSGGTLSIGAGSTTGSVAGDIVDNATLAFNRSDALTYAGAISGSGAVTKLGSGVLTLTGSNSYTGVTTLSAGELKVNGSTGTGALTVASAAILSGTGTIGGATTISGTHMPGNSPGIQSFTSDLTYAQVGLTGPKIFWELAGNTTSNSLLAYDQIDVGGNLNFGAGTGLTLAFGGPGSTVSWSNSFWSHWQQWTFYNVSGTTSGVSNLLLSANDWRDSNNVLLSSVRSGYTFEILQIGEDVVIEFVPEPSTYALAVIGLGVAGLRHLKKRRAARAARLRAAA